MENPTSDSLSATLGNSIQALGRGFDVTSDIRLLYCKGAPGSRLVHLDEDHTKNLPLSHDLVIPNVSVDIDWSPGKRGIEMTPVCSFLEVMILFIHFSFTPFVSRFIFILFLLGLILRGNTRKWMKKHLGQEKFSIFFCFFFIMLLFLFAGWVGLWFQCVGLGLYFLTALPNLT